MATHSDVLQLVAILDEEGFGALAGEILTEANLGREMEARSIQEAKDGVVDAQSDVDDVSEIVRRPIPEDAQFEAAVEILRQRLVAPVRAFAEAEKIVTELAKKEPSPLRFTDPQTGETVQPNLGIIPGDAAAADKLDDLLKRLPSMRGPPGVAAT